MKPQRMWAVICPEETIQSISKYKDTAISRATGKNPREMKEDWEMLVKAGYRCVRVTVQEVAACGL
jgi:hypothetical protein